MDKKRNDVRRVMSLTWAEEYVIRSTKSQPYHRRFKDSGKTGADASFMYFVILKFQKKIDGKFRGS